MHRISMPIVVVLLISSRSLAAPILVPPSLTPGDQYHLVFVSSQPNTANFGASGIAGADAFVQGLADSAGIGATQGITWQAILSDSTTDAISRFNPTAPIYDIQGNRVAASGSALWGVTASTPLENPIQFDENGDSGTFIEVWTGTNTSGTLQRADSNWMAAPSATAARSGLANATGPAWVDAIDTAENVPQSIFASSSLMIVSQSSTVPEPNGIAIWSSAAIIFGILGYHLNRCRKARE